MYLFVDKNYFKENIKNKLEKNNLQPILLYSINYYNKDQFKKDIQIILNEIKNIQNKTALKIITTKTDSYIATQITNLKHNFDIIIGYGGLNSVNRFFIEQTKIDILQDPQNSFHKIKIDFIHHFNSGLNHILCKIAKQNDISLYFSLNFSSGKKLNISKEIARINQNIKFAQKYSIPFYINFTISKDNQIKEDKEIEKILSIFDISSKSINNNKNVLSQIISKNYNKKSPKFITKGIELK